MIGCDHNRNPSTEAMAMQISEMAALPSIAAVQERFGLAPEIAAAVRRLAARMRMLRVAHG